MSLFMLITKMATALIIDNHQIFKNVCTIIIVIIYKKALSIYSICDLCKLFYFENLNED